MPTPKKKKKPAPNAFRKLLASTGQAKTPAPPAPPAVSERRMKTGYVQVGANIPLQLKREVFKLLQDEGMSFSALTEQLLTQWASKR